MSNLTTLITHLSQHITQQQRNSSDWLDKIIYTPLASTLFSEKQQTFAFYFAEMQQNLTQLSQLNEQDVAKIEFLTEKLLAQSAALKDAIFQQTIKYKNTVKTTNLTKREQRRKEIEKLPPRERLSEYYAALQALNDKLITLQNQFKQSREMALRIEIEQQIDITKQRRMRCLNAIEILEDYLTFKQQQAENQLK